MSMRVVTIGLSVGIPLLLTGSFLMEAMKLLLGSGCFLIGGFILRSVRHLSLSCLLQTALIYGLSGISVLSCIIRAVVDHKSWIAVCRCVSCVDCSLGGSVAVPCGLGLSFTFHTYCKCIVSCLWHRARIPLLYVLWSLFSSYTNWY
eukprot:Rmarinus@m.2199